MRFGDYYAEPSRNGLTKPRRIRGTGYKFLNMGELFGNRRIFNIPMDRAPLTEKEQARALLQAGDLLFARQSMVASGAGKCVIFEGDDEPVAFDSHLIRVRLDQALCSSRFTFYFFESPQGRNLIHSIASQGAGVAGITGGDLSELEVDFPPVEEQREIAATLGVLDDKIEVNRKTAATLEEMARALYRSWFVDFDPVHAKASGRAPAHMDTQTAALFPDGFGEDGLPEGWEQVPYLDKIDIVSGGTPKTKEPNYWGGEIPWYSVVDAPTSGLVFTHQTSKSITQAGYKGSSVNMVECGTTIISARGTVGKLAMAGREMVFNQSCYGLKGKNSRAIAFIYFATELAVERLQAMAHGAVFSTITRSTFDSLTLNDSTAEVLKAFEAEAGGYLDRIHALGVENQTLVALRDTLLPRLMSGELRVTEAKEKLEAVA